MLLLHGSNQEYEQGASEYFYIIDTLNFELSHSIESSLSLSTLLYY